MWRDFYFSQKQAEWFMRVDEIWGVTHQKKYVQIDGVSREYTEMCKHGDYPISYNKYNDWVYLGKVNIPWHPHTSEI